MLPGYGLTFGVHTRIDETVRAATERSAAGKRLRQPQPDRRRGGQPAVRRAPACPGTGARRAGGPLILHRLRRDRAAGRGAADGRGAGAGATAARPARQPSYSAVLRHAGRAQPTRAGVPAARPGGASANSYALASARPGCCARRSTRTTCCCTWPQRSRPGNPVLLRRPEGRSPPSWERVIATLPGAGVRGMVHPSPRRRALASAGRLPALARELAARDGCAGAAAPAGSGRHRAAAGNGLTHERSLSVNTTAAGGKRQPAGAELTRTRAPPVGAGGALPL